MSGTLQARAPCCVPPFASARRRLSNLGLSAVQQCLTSVLIRMFSVSVVRCELSLVELLSWVWGCNLHYVKPKRNLG